MTPDHRIQRRFFLSGTLAVVGSALVVPASAAEPLVVIVNPANRENPSNSDLAALFSTRKQNWSGGERAVPFNFPAKHPHRVSFDKKILNMDADDVARYWIDRRIRGGNPPPKQVPSGQMIVRLVEKLPGGIGYVPKSLVSGDVRVVKTL